MALVNMEGFAHSCVFPKTAETGFLIYFTKLALTFLDSTLNILSLLYKLLSFAYVFI